MARLAMVVWLSVALLVPTRVAGLVVDAEGSTAATRCRTPIPVVRYGRTDRQHIALTFDADAFNVGTDEILLALRAARAKATFFLTGTWLRNNPRLVRRMLAEGHQVVTHANTHVDFRTLSDAAIRANLRAAERELARFGVRGWPYIRLPSDAFDQRVLRVLCGEGYSYIFWALDVRDAVGAPKSAAYVEERAVNGLLPARRSGAIMLLHLGKPGTTAALPRILRRLGAQGYRFVTVQEILG